MFSTIELNGMRNTQTSHMMDCCIIYHVTGKTKNARGEFIKSFDDGTESICGLEMFPLRKDYGSSDMTYGANLVEANIDAILRLPLNTVCSVGDEIEIIGRYGEECEPRRYEVDRFLNEGVSGCRAYLKARTVA